MVLPCARARDTVVVVDDSQHARATLTRLLREAGARCVAVQSRAEAELMPLQFVAAVILDLELGEADGLAICQAFRQLDPDLPVAFLTACDDDHRVASAAEWGPVFRKADGGGDAIEWATKAIQSDAQCPLNRSNDSGGEKTSTSEGAAI